MVEYDKDMKQYAGMNLTDDQFRRFQDDVRKLVLGEYGGSDRQSVITSRLEKRDDLKGGNYESGPLAGWLKPGSGVTEAHVLSYLKRFAKGNRARGIKASGPYMEKLISDRLKSITGDFESRENKNKKARRMEEKRSRGRARGPAVRSARAPAAKAGSARVGGAPPPPPPAPAPAASTPATTQTVPAIPPTAKAASPPTIPGPPPAAPPIANTKGSRP